MAIEAREILSNYGELPEVDEELKRHLKSLPDDFWDFVEYEKKYTHFIHTYPAMMIPPIPENILKIIKTYQPNIKTLLDPFAGSGTSLVEGILAGLDVTGLDLNPLACLLSKTKCTPINPKMLEKTSKTLLENIIDDINNENLKVEKPDFHNIDYWFKDYVIRDLQIIKHRINEIKDKDIKALFLVAFSQTIRDCSNTRNSEFKLYRMSEEKLAEFNPDTLEFFELNLEKCINSIAELYERYQGGCSVEVIAQDTREFNLDREFDLLVTSPPYGDSHTTVAYGQFSRLSLQWLDLEEYNYVSSEIEKERLDKYLLGGMNGVEENDLSSDSLREV